jgi:AI-2 transport protein TqsA
VAPPKTGGAQARHLKDGPGHLLLTMACAIIVILGMRYAAGVLNPILVALFIVMGMSPVLDWMRRKKVPSWLAITIVLIFVLALVAALGAILASYVGPFGNQVNLYKDYLNNTISDIQGWFDGHGIDTSAFFDQYVNVNTIANSATSLLGSAVDAFNNVVLVVMILLFMLAQAYVLPKRISSQFALPERFERTFGEFANVIRSYLFTKGWLALVAAAVSTGIYYAFGVDFALLWGIVFFALSFIPNFGFVLSLIPPLTVTLLEQGWVKAAILVAVIVVMNTVVDNVLAPKFMGRAVGLSSLTIFLSLIVWAWILGPIGALISVPLTLMVKLLFFDAYESTRFISMFLTGGKQMTSAPERKRRRKKDRSDCE